MRPLCDEVLSLLRDHDFEWETFPQIFGDFCGFTKDVRSVITRATSDPGFFLKRGHRQITIQRIDDRICYYLGKTDVAKWDLALHANEIGAVLTVEEVVALALTYLHGRPLPERHGLAPGGPGRGAHVSGELERRAAWNGYCGLAGDAASRAPEDFTDWVVTLGTTGFGAGPLPWLRLAAAHAASTAVALAAEIVGHEGARDVAALALAWTGTPSPETAHLVARAAEKMSPPFATEKDARLLVEWSAFMLGELVLEPGPAAVEHAATAAHFATGAVARHGEDPSLFLAEVKRRVHGWALPILELKGQ